MIRTAFIFIFVILMQLSASPSVRAQEAGESDSKAAMLLLADAQSMPAPLATERELQPFTAIPAVKIVVRNTLFSREHVLQLLEFGQGRFRLECVRHSRREGFFYVPRIEGLEQPGTRTTYGLRLSINLDTPSTGAEGD